MWTGAYHEKFLGRVSFSEVLGQEGAPVDIMWREARVTVEEYTVAMILLLTCTDKHVFKLQTRE